jgi:hypothetical protein
MSTWGKLGGLVGIYSPGCQVLADGRDLSFEEVRPNEEFPFMSPGS